jgi:hypothetical protein
MRDGESFDDRHDPFQLFIGTHIIGKGPRRFSTDIDYVGTRLDQVIGLRHSRLNAMKTTAVGK